MRFNPKKATASLFFTIFITGCAIANNTTQAQTRESHQPSQTTSSQEKENSYEGPFGLKMGLSPEEMKSMIPNMRTIKEGRLFYGSDRVPTPHPDFHLYFFTFSKNSGLCRIAAVSKPIKSGDSGSEVKIEFRAIEKLLDEKYKKGEKFDYTTSRNKSPDFWMFQLFKKNRTLVKYWSKESKSTLLNDLSSITLTAEASDLSTAQLILEYMFKNISDCIAEEKAESKKGL